MTAKIITDLGFGDSGKGSVVDALVRSQGIHTVARYNGGAQAAHHVVLPDGTWHKFSQFGSGTFAGARTYLSRFMMVYPHYMNMEADELQTKMGMNPMSLMYVDRECLITTPYHQALNRHRERARGEKRHGSCGVGIGETARYALETPTLAPIVGDAGRQSMKDKLEVLRTHVLAEIPEDDEIMQAWSVKDLAAEYSNWRRLVGIVDSDFLGAASRVGEVLFEGAQGVLLDEWRGFHPYTTWSTTTPTNALMLAEEAGIETEVLGVCRSYMTRHGDGPFPTEDESLLEHLPEKHNATGQFMGGWRVGHLDLMLLSYAVKCCERVDGLVVTHADRKHLVMACVAYRGDGSSVGVGEWHPQVNLKGLDYQQILGEYLDEMEPVYDGVDDGYGSARFIAEMLDVPLRMTSHGPTHEDKRLAPVPVG